MIDMSGTGRARGRFGDIGRNHHRQDHTKVGSLDELRDAEAEGPPDC